MSKQYIASKFLRKFIVPVALMALAGCLPSNDNFDHNITGSVGDGPVIGADISIVGADGANLATIGSSPTADFAVTIQTNDSHYPLLITSTGGIDLVTSVAPDFALRSAVLSPSDSSVANINPFTTIAVEIAQELPGGLNDANVREALNVVSTSLNNGLSTMTGIAVMETAVDTSNIAEIVRASEALGEVVRRTRDNLLGAGYMATGDNVVLAIASDLVDGVLDGRGAARTDARVTAVFGLAQAQISVETMKNELHVQGTNVLERIESATTQVLYGTPTPAFSELPVTADMLDAARLGLTAANALQPAGELTTLLDELNAVTAGMSSADVRSRLTVDVRTALETTLVMVSQGTDSQIEQVNDILGGGAEQQVENSAPIISGQPAPAVTAGSSYGFQPTVTDADGDVLAFSVSRKPSWASFDGSTGRLFGTPATGDVAPYTDISITVSDGQAIATLGPFSITVNSASGEEPPPVSNAAPVINGQPAPTVLSGTPYSFLPTVTDADGDLLTFVVTRKPSWASFDATTGRLHGTPGAGDVAEYRGVSITVSDGQEIDTLGPFSITVEAVEPPPPSNSAPVIDGQPTASVLSGASYGFLPIATDADDDVLAFSVSSKPSWASFDETTGRLFGTPGAADVAVYTNISITVSDGQASRTLGPFSITVEAVEPPPPTNSAPVINGQPTLSVVSGTPYSFLPVATDADDDVLTFSVSRQPSWASFDVTTGRLYGTPGAGDVAEYTDISITVSDGQASRTLGPFSITVDAIALGSVTLNWTPPTQNTDGTPLTDLAGIGLYWGRQEGDYTESVTIDNPGITTYVVENLAPGTWYFVSTAVNSAGVESDYSNSASRVIE